MLPLLAVAFAAFCVWLIVRIVNRRERWAKWTLAAAIGLPMLYALSFGPACWMSSRTNVGSSEVEAVFWPLTLAMSRNEKISDTCDWYARFLAASDWHWIDIGESAEHHWVWTHLEICQFGPTLRILHL